MNLEYLRKVDGQSFEDIASKLSDAKVEFHVNPVLNNQEGFIRSTRIIIPTPIEVEEILGKSLYKRKRDIELPDRRIIQWMNYSYQASYEMSLDFDFTSLKNVLLREGKFIERVRVQNFLRTKPYHR